MVIQRTTVVGLLILSVGCADGSEAPPTGQVSPMVDVPSRAEPAPEKRLIERVRALQEAMRRGDHEYIVDAVPKDVVKASGGRAKLLAELASSDADVRGVAANMELQSPSRVHAIGSQLVSVVHYQSNITLDGRSHPMSACWIAFSDDAGATWFLMSRSKAGREHLRQSRPEVYEVIEPDLLPVTVTGMGSLR